jgi:hypothetical protein
MRNYFVLAMVAAGLTIFNGCQKDDLVVSQLTILIVSFWDTFLSILK